MTTCPETDQPRPRARPVVCGCCHVGPPRAAAHTRTHGAGSQHRAGPARQATASRDATPATGVRGYSPPPPPVSPIRSLIDFHTHSAPDVFGRAVDDDELAALAAARQMEAVVLKSHVALTADRAWLARKHVPGVKVFGGITLNGAVGGINPRAVEWMWRMQGGHGRVVWFPTFDADNHVRRAGTAPSGIRVVDEAGAQHFVLGTDLGQTGNPTPADGLQMFVAGLQAEGITREQIQTMGREVPGALLTG